MQKLLIGLGVLACLMAPGVRAQSQLNSQAFCKGLDSIRISLRIPAMAVALSQGDSLLLEAGFGYSDLENRLPAAASTSFRVASITKTFTSTLLMQLVEAGKLKLDAPISDFGLDLGNPRITVRHLLTHTSEGEPGRHFQYNGYRYGKLGPIIEQAAGQPFYQVLMETLVQPLALTSTAPGISLYAYFGYTQRKKELLPYFETAFSRLANPYQLNEQGEVMPAQYLDEFGAFGGLVSTVRDLLKYSAAIDRNQFVSARTQQAIFTPNRTTTGEVTPYGLGWYVQTYRGLDFYWHFGQTKGESGLLVKVPSRKLTLAVLTNTDQLSQPFPLGDGDLFTSPVGQLFYKYCINDDPAFERVDYRLPVPVIGEKLLVSNPNYQDFYTKELVTQATMAIIGGDSTKASQLYALYGRLNFHSAALPPGGAIVASLQEVGINQELSKAFALTKPTRLRIVGVGENCSGDLTSWCDYGWIENASGQLLWQMPGQPAKPAGGALKNQRVEQVLTLPAGRYRLRYKSDAGHAYNHWDSAPPDNFFWGTILYEVPVHPGQPAKKTAK